MKLQFLGAARTVTGSCHLLEVGRTKLLLDCGLFQGKRKEAFERNRTFAFEPASIHAVVLSHAHIDHSGNLPRLVASGFRGPIYATSATKDLCEWMLRDAANIQEKDVEYVNRKRKKKGERPFEPLYTLRDAVDTLRLFKTVAYGKPADVAPGVRLSFEDAGHILGSASCHLDVDDIGNSGRRTRLVFTGDVGRKDTPILRDPQPPRRADVLISESTYGDRLHEREGDVRVHLRDLARQTYDRGGRLLIPAFSVGRTQRLVYHLNALFNAGELPPMPIFVDSPLSVNVTGVFRDHPECYDKEALQLVEFGDDPFGFSRLTYIHDVEASKALNDVRVPCVIIAPSGMCESGRILHHLKRVAPDPRSTILVVGFMAEHTLGRRIAERAPALRIFGDEFALRAQVEDLCGLSGHADRDELLEFLGKLENPPRRSFLVHGEEKQATAFAGRLRDRGFPAVDVPSPGEVFEV
jgi:metallo-beta-lactamase family protein